MNQIRRNFQFTSTRQLENGTIIQKVTDTCKFFIASNSPEVKGFLTDKFPGSISITNDVTSRSDSDGMFFSFIEWLLLSESALIINTYGR
jgi:hypothetical protein